MFIWTSMPEYRYPDYAPNLTTLATGAKKLEKIIMAEAMWDDSHTVRDEEAMGVNFALNSKRMLRRFEGARDTLAEGTFPKVPPQSLQSSFNSQNCMAASGMAWLADDLAH
jgi:hypothetical protein